MTIETAQAVWKGWRLAVASPASDFVPNLGHTILGRGFESHWEHFMKYVKKLWSEIVRVGFAFSFCGGFYLLLELLWKQHSDVSMFLIGGVIGTMCYFINNIFSYDFDYLAQIGICTASATLFEGIVGNIVNLDYKIWDYRNMPFGNFFNNQCNILFVGVWFLLIAVFIPILDYIDWQLFYYMPDTPPYYKVFGRKIFQFKPTCHCESHHKD